MKSEMYYGVIGVNTWQTTQQPNGDTDETPRDTDGGADEKVPIGVGLELV